jgi:hypothetical protein
VAQYGKALDHNLRRLVERLKNGASKAYVDIFDHEWLLRMLAQRIDDKPFLGLIDTWLKAGILERDATVIDVTSPTGGQVMTQSTEPSWRVIRMPMVWDERSCQAPPYPD